MWLTLTMTCLGLMVGIIIHFFFRLLRQSRPILVIAVGWLVAAFGIVCAVTSGLSFFAMRGDPHAPMGPIRGFLALAIVFLFGLCSGISLLHRGLFGMTWLNAFAIVMAEVGLTAGVVLFSNETMYSFAGLLRGGSQDIGRILASYQLARGLLADFALGLVLTLVLVEITLGLTIRKMPVPHT